MRTKLYYFNCIILYNTKYKKYVKSHSKKIIQVSKMFNTVIGSRNCDAVNITNPQNFL